MRRFLLWGGGCRAHLSSPWRTGLSWEMAVPGGVRREMLQLQLMVSAGAQAEESLCQGRF